MKLFKDNASREWKVEITVATIKRVRDLLGVDLMEVVDGDLVQRLIRDPILLCDVIYVVCKPQADEKSITDEDFGQAMAGDVIEQATTALLEELVAFSPSPKDRENLARALEATNRVMDRTRDMVKRRLDSGEVEKAADRLIETEMAKLDTELATLGASPPVTDGSSSESAPASLDTIRAP